MQGSTFSFILTQADFKKNLQPLPATLKLRAARHQLLSPEDVKSRQCKLGELCWFATVYRPDICARLARIASRINSLRGRDVYRINDLVKTAELLEGPQSRLGMVCKPHRLSLGQNVRSQRASRCDNEVKKSKGIPQPWRDGRPQRMGINRDWGNAD